MGEFGNRMKSYEDQKKIMKGIPFVARIDGKSFSKWTKNFEKPYDKSLHDAFITITTELIKETHCVIGYTQSDEITLVFDENNAYFDRKIQKLCSVIASISSAVMHDIFEKRAYFDCRVFGVPTQSEATNCVLWRELDATKNAISSAAHFHFSHKDLQGLNGNQMQEKLFQEKGINFNDYPDFFKRGSFIQNRKVLKLLNEVECMRSEIKRIDMPKFSLVKNRIEVIFNKENPVVYSEDISDEK